MSARCPARTFAEQIEGLTSAYARRTPMLRRMLEAIGLALAGRSGVRLAGRLGICVGRSTMLRLIRALPDPGVEAVEVLGVDACRSTNQLYEQLRRRGYRGSLRTLRRCTAGLRQATARPAQPPPPAPRKVTSWILTPPAKLAAEDHHTLQQITARCEEISVTCALVRQFADMLCGRHGHNLPAWTARAAASPVRELRSFAAGLRKDWAAVTAGLTLPYSSGPIEGHVNRIILWNQRCQVTGWRTRAPSSGDG